MIPTTLDQWTKESIIELLSLGYYETEYFDFKEMLPARGDTTGKERLKAACCAFANSSGGFLVFGVANSSSSPAQNRLTGLSPNPEFFEHFGNYPAACEPSILWTPKNPPILLDTGNVVQVVHIPRSWNAPHCFDVQGSAKRFMKRTHKGDEDMSYEEIRLMFLQYYEKRLKLQLLRAELEAISNAATSIIVPVQELGGRDPTGDFSLAVLESVLADTYTVLAQQPMLLTILNSVRWQCRQVNQDMQRWAPHAYNQAANTGAVLQERGVRMNRDCIQIRNTCTSAIQVLDEFLSKA